MSTTISIDGKEVWPKIGYGAMGLSGMYGAPGTDEEGKAVLRKAIEIGCTMWNTSDIYGVGHNEKLIGDVLREGYNREKVFLVTKFGVRVDLPQGRGYDGSPEYVHRAIDASIKRMGGIKPDGWIYHRIDESVPIEDTVRAMDEVRKEGKCRYIGLSECSAATLRRASRVARISFVEVEYSPWVTVMERNGVLDVCKELGITVLAYSPLGHGFLTGRYKKLSDFSEDDYRFKLPGLQGEQWKQNWKLVEAFQTLAIRKGCAPSQLALAWLAAQGPNILPIPGTKSEKYLVENFDARNLHLTEQEMKDVRQAMEENPLVGGRSPAEYTAGLEA